MMAYVEARHYSNSYDMIASAKAVRDRLLKPKPKPRIEAAPEREFYIEPQKVFADRTRTMSAEHNAHVIMYLMRHKYLAFMAYAGHESMDSIDGPDIGQRFITVENPKVENIIKEVSVYFRVPVIDLKSNRRTRAIVKPRQVAMYLSKTLTLQSLPEIGRRMGGRDHTTVLHAVTKIAALKKTDASISKAIADLTAIIRGQVAS